MSDDFLPYGSNRYTQLVTKQCQPKVVVAMLAPYGSSRFASISTKQETSKKVAAKSRLVRRNATQA